MTTEVIQRTNTEPWYAGMKNLLKRELLHERSRMYWIQQLVIWALFTNGMVALVLSASNFTGEVMEATLVISLGVFYGMLALFISIFIPILLQGTIIDEKASGTAAWILSKPVSKKSYILSKLIASTLAIIVVSVIINGVIGYVVFGVYGFILNIPGYIMTLGLTCVVVIYFISLTIMLGTFTSSRGKVLAGAVGLGVGAQIVANYFSLVLFLIPYSLPVLGIGFVIGSPVMGLELILLSACVQIVVFILISLHVFDRTEL